MFTIRYFLVGLALAIIHAPSSAKDRADTPLVPGTGLTLEATGVPSGVGLKGLWALHVSADGALMTTRDVQAFYPPGSLTLDDQAAAFGFSIRAQRHLNDAFYIGVGFDNLTKSFHLNDSSLGVNNVYEWIGLFPNALLGWTFYRTEQAFFSVEGQAGLISLNQATWTQEGGSKSGNFSGSGTGWVASTTAHWFVIPSVGLHASLGYRRATVQPVTLVDELGATITPAYAKDFEVDFSGPLIRLGISFFWGMKNPWGHMHESPEAPPPPPEEPETP